MFDSIIKEAQEKFSLDDKAGNLLASLLGLIANPANGGFGGFVGRFHDAGLGDLVDSWVTTGDNTPVSGEQIESALGEETVAAVAAQSGVDQAAATSALALMTPHVVDELTPGGVIPDEAGLISKIGGFLKDHGGAIGAAILGGLGTAGTIENGAAETLADAADAGLEKVTDEPEKDGEAADEDNVSILRWLLPLLLLGLLVVVGYGLFGKSTPLGGLPKMNSNVNKTNANTVNSRPNQ